MHSIVVAMTGAILLSLAIPARSLETSGDVTAEYRYFPRSASRNCQSADNLSISGEPEFHYGFPESRDSMRATLFFRLDENDDHRAHLDLRSFYWHHVRERWELSLGVKRVFWGVTESVHLVNIINQIDNVESPDGEEMLGQPMIDLSLVRDWGFVDLFVLPYFRERSFPGRCGRPGSGIVISNDRAVYASAAGKCHTDWAARWSHTQGAWDMGLSHFYGTSREPRFDPALQAIDEHGEKELVPIYDIIHQTGLDLQGTFDAWLLKLEAIHRSGQGDSFMAAAAGFEYTFFDVAGSGVDIGVLGEYLYDQRDEQPMDNDVSIGLRLVFNDIQSTECLAVVIGDMDNRSSYFYLEASRRLGNDFRLGLEYRGVFNVVDGDPLKRYASDDYLQLSVGFYF